MKKSQKFIVISFWLLAFLLVIYGFFGEKLFNNGTSIDYQILTTSNDNNCQTITINTKNKNLLFSFDDGENWQKENYQEICESKTVKIKIKNIIDDTTISEEKEVEILNDVPINPEDPTIPNLPLNPQEPMIPEILSHISNISCIIGETKSLKFIINNFDINDLKYISNNIDIVSISKNSDTKTSVTLNVKCMKEGTAAITGSYENIERKVDVQVYATKPINPTVSYSINPGSYNTIQTVTITPTDNSGSRINYFNVQVSKDGKMVSQNNNLTSSTYSVSLSSEGTWEVCTYVIDKAGNTLNQSNLTATKYYCGTYIIDRTAPTVKYNLNPGLYNQNQTVTITPSDTGGSNLKVYNVITYKNNNIISTNNNLINNTYSVSLNSEGTWKVCTYVIDKAGNTLNQSNLTATKYYCETYTIDRTVPTVKYNLTPGSYNQNQTVTIIPSDTGGSNLKSYNVITYKNNNIISTNNNLTNNTYSVSLNSEGTWKVCTYVIDKAGNTLNQSNLTTTKYYCETYIIDKIAPKVTYSLKAGTYDSDKELTVKVSDTGNSGIKYYSIIVNRDGKEIFRKDNITTDTYTLNLSGEGTYNVNTKVWDKAGNTNIEDPLTTTGYYKQGYKIAYNYKIHFLSVNGDAILIESGGKYGLVDLGTAVDTDNTLIPYLKQLGVTSLDFVVITHLHNDHYGNIRSLLKNIEIKSFYMKKSHVNVNDSYIEARVPVSALGSKLHYVESLGDGYTIFKNGNTTVKLYNTQYEVSDIPHHVTGTEGYYSTNENDNSIVTLVTMNNYKTILSGDFATKARTNKIYSKIGQVNVYKMGHHGNLYNDDAEAPYSILKPQYTIISSRSDGNMPALPIAQKHSKVYHTIGKKVIVDYSKASIEVTK